MDEFSSPVDVPGCDSPPEPRPSPGIADGGRAENVNGLHYKHSLFILKIPLLILVKRIAWSHCHVTWPFHKWFQVNIVSHGHQAAVGQVQKKCPSSV